MTQWTPQQLAFFDFLQSTDASCVLQAKAGTGKTTTLVEGINHLHGSILAVAFNTKIKKEFEAKIGDSAVCKTMNGLGHRALCNMFGGRISIDRDKNFKVVKEIMKDEPDSSKYAWSPVLEDTPENWQDLADHHNIEFDPLILSLARRALRLSNKMAWNKECDFDDQIYMCQPEGTKVLTEKGIRKNIEEIKAGDKVISYNRRISKLVGFYNHASVVNEVQKSFRDENIYRVSTIKNSTRATKEHKWLVRMQKESLWTIYIMRKGEHWRIGQARLYRRAGGSNKYDGLGPIMRARSEGADEVWILSTSESSKGAREEELILSAQYGISTASFVDEAGVAVHNALGDATRRASVILNDHGRNINFPFWPAKTMVRENGRVVLESQRNFKHPTLIETCNLMPEFMLLPEVNKRQVRWTNFDVRTEHYTGYVFSLEVHRHGLYVADGIVTHNSVCWNATFDKYENVIVDEAQDLSVMQHRIVEKSVKHGGRIIAAGDIHQAIYGWRAAASDSIPQLIEKFHLEELDLTVSFRCGTRIIEEAQAIV
ncbi:MAG: UvrD-helicase domain-containing protein, partial [Candidatus Thorarchaeota archaeon]